MAGLDVIEKVKELTVKIAQRIKGASAGTHGGFSGVISIKMGPLFGKKDMQIVELIGQQQRSEKNFSKPKIIVTFKNKDFPEYRTIVAFLDDERKKFIKENIDLVIVQ